MSYLKIAAVASVALMAPVASCDWMPWYSQSQLGQVEKQRDAALATLATEKRRADAEKTRADGLDTRVKRLEGDLSEFNALTQRYLALDQKYVIDTSELKGRNAELEGKLKGYETRLKGMVPAETVKLDYELGLIVQKANELGITFPLLYDYRHIEKGSSVWATVRNAIKEKHNLDLDDQLCPVDEGSRDLSILIYHNIKGIEKNNPQQAAAFQKRLPDLDKVYANEFVVLFIPKKLPLMTSDCPGFYNSMRKN